MSKMIKKIAIPTKYSIILDTFFKFWTLSVVYISIWDGRRDINTLWLINRSITSILLSGWTSPAMRGIKIKMKWKNFQFVKWLHRPTCTKKLKSIWLHLVLTIRTMKCLVTLIYFLSVVSYQWRRLLCDFFGIWSDIYNLWVVV